MEHHFNVDIAVKYGMLEAVILNNLYFWIKKNEANDKNYHDGYYWTYNSAKAFHKLFPYVSEHRIRNALKHLEEEGLIVTGNYNQSAYDRTIWYALTENAISILQNYKMEVSKSQNQSCKNDTPIPDNKPNNEHIINIINYLNEKAGTHYRPTTDATVKVINARLNEKFTVEDFKTVIDKKTEQWKGTPMEEFLRPQTLFGTKFESYLNQTIVKEEKKQEPIVPRSKAYREFEPEPEIEAVEMPDDVRENYNRFMNGL